METQLSDKATLNDRFRREGYAILLTPGVQAFDADDIVTDIVRGYDDFNEDNDPHGEHDFGSFKFCGKRLFWKIDYYNPTHDGWCNPLSPECNRVLTILLAEEY